MVYNIELIKIHIIMQDDNLEKLRVNDVYCFSEVIASTAVRLPFIVRA